MSQPSELAGPTKLLDETRWLCQPFGMEIDRIIEMAGGTTRLGELAGVDRTTVNYWKTRARIPVERALVISKALGIPLHEIRPDVWGIEAAAS
jgi:DNA-binding transcriptional regulator YdaS (Cro superfamily)